MICKKAVSLLPLLVLLTLLGCFLRFAFTERNSSSAYLSQNEIVIGASLELSGRFASTGAASLQAIELAVAEINASGGLLGSRVRLATIDNHSSEEHAASALQNLIEQQKVCAILGPSYSAIAIAGVPVSEKNGIPFICTWGTGPRVTVDDSGRTRPYAFRACFVDSFQGAALGRFAASSLKLNTAVIYMDESTYYSRSMTSFFEPAFLQNGGRILQKGSYRPPLEETAVRETLQRLFKDSPDSLFLPGYYTDVGTIIRLARESGFKGPILGGDGWEENLLITLIDPSLLKNTYYSNHYAPDDSSPEVQSFIRRYKNFSGGSEPIQAAVLAYDAATILFDAIRRAASTSPAKIRDALETTSNLPCVSGIISIDKHHTPAKNAVIIEIKDGRGKFRERVSPN